MSSLQSPESASPRVQLKAKCGRQRGHAFPQMHDAFPRGCHVAGWRVSVKPSAQPAVASTHQICACILAKRR
eukprot:1087295-Amphidinium_carterae.1